jgi:hypothetical protein
MADCLLPYPDRSPATFPPLSSIHFVDWAAPDVAPTLSGCWGSRAPPSPSAGQAVTPLVGPGGELLRVPRARAGSRQPAFRVRDNQDGGDCRGMPPGTALGGGDALGVQLGEHGILTGLAALRFGAHGSWWRRSRSWSEATCGARAWPPGCWAAALAVTLVGTVLVRVNGATPEPERGLSADVSTNSGTTAGCATRVVASANYKDRAGVTRTPSVESATGDVLLQVEDVGSHFTGHHRSPTDDCSAPLRRALQFPRQAGVSTSVRSTAPVSAFTSRGSR